MLQECVVLLQLILHYTTLHYTTLHYTTLHYTTLHYTTLHYTTLHYTTLHYTWERTPGRNVIGECNSSEILLLFKIRAEQAVLITDTIFASLPTARCHWCTKEPSTRT